MKLEPPRRPLALKELAALLGREEPLYAVHGAVLRAAHAIRPVVESGALLAACSDEFNGEVRAAFDRDVARLLTAPDVPGTRRVFSVSNLGGRVEPGAIALANLHFTSRSRESGWKLLLVEIASHVGRRETKAGVLWGELERFGVPSPCCGALRLLLDAEPVAEAVRFPWFDQLTAFFGPERLAALRADTSPYRMLRAAVVHAVLQAESAIVDLLREPPATPTHVLLVALVIVNRRGPDNAIPVGMHHLLFEHGAAHIELGASLRSTPGALVFHGDRGLLRITSPHEPEEEHVPAPPRATPVELAPALRTEAASHAVRGQLEHHRRQWHAVSGRPHAVRIYARPILRALVQGLSVVAPELGLAALAFESGREVFRAAGLSRLHERGPSTAAARATLHDLEPRLQQLSQREAREVLELLLAETGPLSRAGYPAHAQGRERDA